MREMLPFFVVDEIAMILQQPIDAVVRAAAFLIRG